MDDSSGMAVVDSVAELIEEKFDLICSHGVFVFAEIFFHIIVNEFKDEI